MAKDMRVVYLCDPCLLGHLGNIEAVATHVISVDGMSPREVEVCERDQAALLQLYAAGRDIEPAPAPPTAQPKPAPKEIAPPKKEKKQEKDAEKKPDGMQRVLCPLDHPAQGGGAQLVSYNDRSSHVDQCHAPLKAWQVEWGDPNKILAFYCERDSCPRYGFTSKRGLQHHMSWHKQHDPAGEREGDPQKTDELSAAGAENSA